VEVLYLTYDGLTDPLGGAQILPYLKGLAGNLPLTFHVLSFEKPERWLQTGSQLTNSLRNGPLRWHPLRFSRKPPVLAKAYDLWQMERTATHLLKRHPIRLLHARSYVAGWTAHKLSQRYGVPWIFDMRGFWADERRETQAWPNSSPFYQALYRLWKRREQTMLASAAHIIVLTEAAKTFLTESGLPSDRITVIPCVADYDHFFLSAEAYALERQRRRTELHLPHQAYVLGYVGSIGPLYEVREMLRFFRVLQSLREEAYMVFYTPAAEEAVLRYWDETGLPRSALRLRFVPRSELPAYLTALDSSIIFCPSGFSRIGSSPTRIAELLAMDIPVVVQADLGDHITLAAQIPEGLYLCERFDEAVYYQVARCLLERKPRVPPLREASAPFLSLPVGLQRYKSVYERLLSPVRVLTK